LEAVQSLVEHGASLEERDLNGTSILMHALQTNNTNIVNYIREKMNHTKMPFNNKENYPLPHSENTMVNNYNPMNVNMNMSMNLPKNKTKINGKASTTSNTSTIKSKSKPKVLQRYPFQ